MGNPSTTIAMFLVVTTGRITFMENQLIDSVEDLKDSIIDRIHYLADMGVFSIFLCEKMEDVPSDCGGVIQISGESFSST